MFKPLIMSVFECCGCCKRALEEGRAPLAAAARVEGGGVSASLEKVQSKRWSRMRRSATANGPMQCTWQAAHASLAPRHMDDTCSLAQTYAMRHRENRHSPGGPSQWSNQAVVKSAPWSRAARRARGRGTRGASSWPPSAAGPAGSAPPPPAPPPACAPPVRRRRGTVHRASCIQHPAPCIMHPASGTVHHASGTVHHASGTVHHASSIRHRASCIRHRASCIQHPAPCIMHPASGTVHHASGTVHHASSIRHRASCI